MTATTTRASAPVRRRTGVVALVLVLALVAAVVVGIVVGPADLTPAELWRILVDRVTGAEPASALRSGIVWELRMPRTLTAAAVGAGLAIAGVVVQSVTRNPLADPYLLGLSSGASFAAVCVVLLGVGAGLALPLPVAAFGGALLALVCTLVVASRARAAPTTSTVLAGIAVSAFFGALTSLVVFWAATGDSYREILGWLLGSLGTAGWASAAIAGGALLLVGVPLAATGRLLDAFAFGDRSAGSLGVDVRRTRTALLVATALLTGAMVSVSGAIGFVGLVVPHAVRLLVGPGHRAVLPLSGLVGGGFLVLADTIARTAFDPRELPVGVVTAVVGAPVFAIVLARRARTGAAT